MKILYIRLYGFVFIKKHRKRTPFCLFESMQSLLCCEEEGEVVSLGVSIFWRNFIFIGLF